MTFESRASCRAIGGDLPGSSTTSRAPGITQ
jgi:hypothetical protein